MDHRVTQCAMTSMPTRRVTYLDPTVAKRLDRTAEEQKRSVASQIALYIERGLEQDGVK